MGVPSRVRSVRWRPPIAAIARAAGGVTSRTPRTRSVSLPPRYGMTPSSHGPGAQPTSAHRLLPQPYGFEGFGAGRVLAALRNLSVANREDLRFGLVSFDAAKSGASAVPLNRDHRVSAGVDQFDQFKPKLVERVDPVLEVGTQGLPAVDRTDPAELTRGWPVLDILCELLHPPIKPALGIGLVVAPHDLHVLLRHRPPSISGRVTLRQSAAARAPSARPR